MAKKTKITREEIKTYIPVRQVSTIYVQEEEGLVPREVSASILVPPDRFPNSLQDYSLAFVPGGEVDDEQELAEFLRLRREIEEKYPTRFYLLDQVPGIDPDKEIRDLTPEDIKRVFDYFRGELISDKGQISVSLSSNIALQKGIVSLDSLNTEEERFIDRRGKPVVLTNPQTKIVYALSHYLSQFQGDGDIVSYIDEIEKNPRKAKSGLKPVVRTINLKSFYKDYLSMDGKVRGVQLARLQNELKTLSEINQVFLFGDMVGKDGEKRKLRLTTPLITTLETLDVVDEDGKPDIDSFDIQVNIRFSPIFLYKMKREYLPFSKRIFLLWGKRGSGTETELFSVLFSDLASKYPRYVQTAKTKVHAVRRNDFPKEEYLKEVERVRRESLTYDQNISTLLERVRTDYSSTRQYRSIFKTDLERSLSVLRDDIGLIQDWKLRKNAKGGESLRIVFKEDYLRGGENA